jgi:hypothetical protein
MAKLRKRSGGFEKRKIHLTRVKRKTVSQKVRESDSLLVSLFIFFLCVASVSYLFQANSLATKGYEVRGYENELKNLQDENQGMKDQEAQLRSIKNFEAEKTRLTAMGSSDINYLANGSTALAMRK